MDYQELLKQLDIVMTQLTMAKEAGTQGKKVSVTLEGNVDLLLFAFGAMYASVNYTIHTGKEPLLGNDD